MHVIGPQKDVYHSYVVHDIQKPNFKEPSIRYRSTTIPTPWYACAEGGLAPVPIITWVPLDRMPSAAIWERELGIFNKGEGRWLVLTAKRDRGFVFGACMDQNWRVHVFRFTPSDSACTSLFFFVFVDTWRSQNIVSWRTSPQNLKVTTYSSSMHLKTN